MIRQEIYQQVRKLRLVAEADRRVAAVGRAGDKVFIYVCPQRVDLGKLEEIIQVRR